MKNILLLFGGTNSEHEISVSSASNVFAALGRHNVLPVYITKEGRWLLYDGKPMGLAAINWHIFGTPCVLSPDRGHGGLLRIVGDKLRVLPIDVCVPILHGECGEDGAIAALCALAGIPVVGCGMTAGAIAMDKALARMAAQSVGAKIAPQLVLSDAQIANDLAAVMKKIRYRIGYPLFVKPARGGSSIGTSRVDSREALPQALRDAAGLCEKVIAERAVVGREVEVSILDIDGISHAWGPGEVLSDGKFYGFDEKYGRESLQVAPIADISDDCAQQVRSMALKIFGAIGGRGLARVDFFLTDKVLIFNEINTMPGFTHISMFTKTLAAYGYDLPQVMDILIAAVLPNNAEADCE